MRFDKRCPKSLARWTMLGALLLQACSAVGTTTCDLPKSRGPSESCCESFGVDACGANLFCAAFDGRTQATCYVEGSRRGLEQCGADRHCASGRCSAATSKCGSMPGEACELATGCSGVDPSGRVWGCAGTPSLTCQAVSLRRCGSAFCASEPGDVCAVPSAGITLPCPSGTICQPDGVSELSTCVVQGITGGEALYGPCQQNNDCGDGTYDGVCLPMSNGGVCGYAACLSSTQCTAGKTCKQCPISGGRHIAACVSDAHLGYQGQTCQ